MMDRRIRWYFLIQVFFYWTNAAAYWYGHDRLSDSSTFQIVESIFTLDVWIVILFVMGMLFLGGILRPKALVARYVLSLSVGVKLVFGIGLLFSGTWTPGIGSYLTLAATDFLIAGLPRSSIRA